MSVVERPAVYCIGCERPLSVVRNSQGEYDWMCLACHACGGPMMYAVRMHFGDTPAWECMMCGRSNDVPPVVADARTKHTAEIRAPRKNRQAVRERAEKDSDYRAFLGVITAQGDSFTALDIATQMGVKSPMVGAWLRRADHDGWVRSTGLRGLLNANRHHYQVAVWEAVKQPGMAAG